MYKRKKARWSSLYRSIERKVEKPIHFDSDYLTRKLDLNVNIFGQEFERSANMAIRIKSGKCCGSLLYRVGAIFASIWCAFILFNESILIFDRTGSDTHYFFSQIADNFWATYFTTIFVTGGICISSFFTIFKLKFSDYI